MKRLVELAVILIGVGVQARAQSISPTILVNAACGSGPGEFDFDPNTAPAAGLAVGDKNDIFIIDELNNRVQHFDGSGGYLGEIAFPPAIAPTAKEKERNPDLPERPTVVQQIIFINGVLYALQQRCVNGYADYACRVGYVLRAQGNIFVNADKEKEAWQVHRMFTLKYINASADGALRAAYARLKLNSEDFLKKFPLGQGCGASRNCFLDQILFDDKARVLVLSSVGFRVFDSAGGLLFDDVRPSNADVLSKNGELYRLFYLVPERGKGCVQVEKYSPQGK